jgi:hypothetical protein
MTTQTTRRALIGGAGLAAVAAITPAIAARSTTGNDAELLARWNLRQDTYAQACARGPWFYAETHSTELCVKHDAQEIPIVDATAETVRGALAQAWLAWGAQGQVRTEDDHKRAALIHAADFDALADLERRKQLDWDDSTMFAVIRSLRALAGEA